MNSTDNTIRL